MIKEKTKKRRRKQNYFWMSEVGLVIRVVSLNTEGPRRYGKIEKIKNRNTYLNTIYTTVTGNFHYLEYSKESIIYLSLARCPNFIQRRQKTSNMRLIESKRQTISRIGRFINIGDPYSKDSRELRTDRYKSFRRPSIWTSLPSDP